MPYVETTSLLMEEAAANSKVQLLGQFLAGEFIAMDCEAENACHSAGMIIRKKELEEARD